MGNLGSLGAFKYSKFIFSQLELFLANFDLHVNLTKNFPQFMYILPVGISFYTFQSMSYTIDIYKRDLVPTKNIFKFFAYLSMFPQLVAGPIVRAKTLLPQLDRLKRSNEIERWHGLKLIAFGFFKKMFIADNLAPLVNSGFSDVNSTSSTIYWWLIMVAFAFQIYCDFSGYTDIARGIAKWMGFHFKMNFNHPYRATSIRNFWQRWHISLSTWFKDYVYIPLGGSKNGKLRSDGNMWITMVVSGFWHGAAWNFIIWGCLHALFLSIERLTKWPRLFASTQLKGLATFIVMIQVLVAWVFFRAQNLTDAFVITKNMLVVNFNTKFPISADIRNGFYYVLIALIIEYVLYNIKLKRLVPNPKNRKVLDIILIATMVAVTIFLRGKGHEFIYFQF
ncbi:MBOAT family protein [Prolixibacteraceae bacterium Z1-6]|uniref:MBOAT family protein n=1 Tax=Draconibacterium aestuarii TaxID=2998507 RepID=A0A9X3FIY0_9BACT|nr:MBOAT family protein [Prolixibacteraceae bacterium Z1-6]